MSFSSGGEYNEVVNNAYIAGTVNVSDSEVELKVGASPLEGRQRIIVYNKGSVEVLLGPSGSIPTNGIPLPPGRSQTWYLGDELSLFAITESGSSDIVVQEIA